MANCCEMNEGDLFVCRTCGLELRVAKACACKTGKTSCHVPLQCCGQNMEKKNA